ncbi:RabJ-like_protein [Hexamita inflata]|uniref:RabJ-like_protein n=1 Tax=Hexamita inflata TaxID=28002 RepID=A0ABP1HFC7_9EUKA
MFKEVRVEFYDSHATVYFCDFSRRQSLTELQTFVDEGSGINPDVVNYIIVNKTDLKGQITDSDVNVFSQRIKAKAFRVSAKTGEGVQEAMDTIFTEMVKKYTKQ